MSDALELVMPGDFLVESQDIVKCFKALSDSARLSIIAHLADNVELSVSELVRALEVSQPLISWHLRRLERVGLITVRRKGRRAYCSLNRDVLRRYFRDFADVLGETWQPMGNG